MSQTKNKLHPNPNPWTPQAILGSALIHASAFFLFYTATKSTRSWLAPSSIQIQLVTQNPNSLNVIQPLATAKKAQTRPQKPVQTSSDPAPQKLTVGTPESESTNTGNTQELDLFKLNVMKKIHEKIEYPLSLRSRRIEGAPRLRITLSQSGQLLNTEITESSGHTELDHLAIEAVTRAQPYPKLSSTERLTLSVPVIFKITTRPNSGNR